MKKKKKKIPWFRATVFRLVKIWVTGLATSFPAPLPANVAFMMISDKEPVHSLSQNSLVSLWQSPRQLELGKKVQHRGTVLIFPARSREKSHFSKIKTFLISWAGDSLISGNQWRLSKGELKHTSRPFFFFAYVQAIFMLGLSYLALNYTSPWAFLPFFVLPAAISPPLPLLDQSSLSLLILIFYYYHVRKIGPLP